MSHAPETGGHKEAKSGGKGGILGKEFLETSPVYLFGAMLFGIVNRKGISDFLSEASKTLDFFSAPFTGGGGGGHSPAAEHH